MADEMQTPTVFSTETPGRLTFDDENDLMTYVVQFGQEQGMAITKGRTRKLNNMLTSIDFKCDRGGRYRDRRTRPAASKLRSGWSLRAINNEHNHELDNDMSGHPSSRRLDAASRQTVAVMTAAGSQPRQIVTSLRQINPSVNLTARTIYNERNRIRQAQLDGRTPISALMDELACMDEYVMDFRVGADDNITHLFFAHNNSIELVKLYGSVLLTDCTYKTNQYWIGHAKIWGKSARSRKNQRKRGRNLWVVDEQLRAFATDTSDSVKAYWKYLQHDTKYITIGYARKSPTDETKESRIRLLQLMVNKLYFRGKCEEVFVSPICKADQPILERDSPKQDDLLLHLKGSHGDISDLVARVYFSPKPFRLVIIDYTGLSTSENDIRIFLEQCSKIKEVVVDHGSSFEILSRFDLLKNMDLEKFKCRHANVQRSK